MAGTITILGIESSCDDTAAAVVRSSGAQDAEILSSVVSGQADLHKKFGGVVPEIAARAHAEILDIVTMQALSDAGIKLADIDAIAVTAGPGLIGGVVSGAVFAKGLAAGSGKPVIAVNHLAGHALTPRLTSGLGFPFVLLLASGGHCQFLLVNDFDQFEKLGSTIDDAPGEAFDKVARILGLEQPGGPYVEAFAKEGDPKRFPFPRPLLNRKDCNLSFSGLKTAVMRATDELLSKKGGLTRQDQADICASFQAAVVETLAEKTRFALESLVSRGVGFDTFAAAGGVIANQSIRAALETVSMEQGMKFTAPPIALCTDNAAMIAWAGSERFRAGVVDDLSFSARPRWPLDTTSQTTIGSGKKGAKA